MSSFTPSSLSKVKRGAKRATYDRKEVYEIIDAHFICHVPYPVHGTTITIPTGYGRSGDTIYLHGAVGNRMLNQMLEQEIVSLTVTHMDGLVLARSAFHHSFNYRSAVVFGKPRLISDLDERNQALKIITDNIIPDRWDEVRQPNEKELKITSVVAVDITEASAKIRSGGPIDDEEDYELDIWAGVVPMETKVLDPVSDVLMKKELPTPTSATNFRM